MAVEVTQDSLQDQLAKFQENVKGLAELAKMTKEIWARGDRSTMGNLSDYNLEDMSSFKDSIAANTIDYKKKKDKKYPTMTNKAMKKEDYEEEEEEEDTEAEKSLIDITKFVENLSDVFNKSLKAFEYRMIEKMSETQCCLDAITETQKSVDIIGEDIKKSLGESEKDGSEPEGAPLTKFTESDMQKADLDHSVFLKEAEKLYKKNQIPAKELLHLKKTGRIEKSSSLYKSLKGGK